MSTFHAFLLVSCFKRYTAPNICSPHRELKKHEYHAVGFSMNTTCRSCSEKRHIIERGAPRTARVWRVPLTPLRETTDSWWWPRGLALKEKHFQGGMDKANSVEQVAEMTGKNVHLQIQCNFCFAITMMAAIRLKMSLWRHRRSP